MNRYKLIRIDGKQCYEHRAIMEEHLGRKLGFNECVHHIDGTRETTGWKIWSWLPEASIIGSTL